MFVLILAAVATALAAYNWAEHRRLGGRVSGLEGSVYRPVPAEGAPRRRGGEPSPAPAWPEPERIRRLE
ncbi:MAG TPA: hypothetical protein VF796_01470, partial [Humisphaera sp.]